MLNTVNYLIGVDGGGSGTRVAIANLDGFELARGSAGASGLRNGADFAWNSILQAVTSAFYNYRRQTPDLAHMAIGMGLAGVHNKEWAEDFAGANPGFARLRLETDAYTTLLGAHQGRPGGIVATGTGSVGESILNDGTRRQVGGWGFPCGDEAGGAWLGLRAINHLQQVLDGRDAASVFSDAILQRCGGNAAALFRWLASANQGSYAQLAPVVVDCASRNGIPIAVQIMQEASREIVKIAIALDQSLTIPIALCGGLAQPYLTYLPTSLLDRLIPARGDSVSGALLMIKNAMEST